VDGDQSEGDDGRPRSAEVEREPESPPPKDERLSEASSLAPFCLKTYLQTR